MKIDLDELAECKKCGVIFNFRIVAESDEYDSGILKGNCPQCNKEFIIYT